MVWTVEVREAARAPPRAHLIALLGAATLHALGDTRATALGAVIRKAWTRCAVTWSKTDASPAPDARLVCLRRGTLSDGLRTQVCHAPQTLQTADRYEPVPEQGIDAVHPVLDQDDDPTVRANGDTWHARHHRPCRCFVFTLPKRSCVRDAQSQAAPYTRLQYQGARKRTPSGVVGLVVISAVVGSDADFAVVTCLVRVVASQAAFIAGALGAPAEDVSRVRACMVARIPSQPPVRRH